MAKDFLELNVRGGLEWSADTEHGTNSDLSSVRPGSCRRLQRRGRGSAAPPSDTAACRRGDMSYRWVVRTRSRVAAGGLSLITVSGVGSAEEPGDGPWLGRGAGAPPLPRWGLAGPAPGKRSIADSSSPRSSWRSTRAPVPRRWRCTGHPSLRPCRPVFDHRSREGVRHASRSFSGFYSD